MASVRHESESPEMVQPILVPWAKFGLPVSLLSTTRVLAQAPIVQNELHHDVSKPLRELAVNAAAMPSGILKGGTNWRCSR